MYNDLLVIDASTVLAGPSVGTFFAELGARVIKIEHPKHPDVTRSWKLASELEDSTVSAYFSSVNFKKEYVQLDLTQTADRLKLDQWLEKADIFISNFKKGDAAKFDIEDDRIGQLNPRLINAKISGYGDESDRVAYDLILQAESGFMSINGTEGSGPIKMPVALIDILAAHHLKEGILAALYERTQSNKGKSVSVSLYDAAVSSLVNQASNYLMEGHVPQRIGSKHPNIAPYGELFTTNDGATITFAIGSDEHFRKLCSLLELDALTTDPKFDSNQHRVINRNELAQFMAEKVKSWQSNELLSQLHKLTVPAGKIKNLREVFEDEQAQRLIREEVIDGIKTKRITSIVFK